jgi:hypothetical protein
MKPGTLVKLSAEGMRRWLQTEELRTADPDQGWGPIGRIGLVQQLTHEGECYAVTWFETGKTAEIHKTYIEPVENPDPE